MTALPNLYDCIDPAISEVVQARNVLVEQMARLEAKLKDFTESRAQRQTASLALAAEDVSRTAFQIQELAASIHRGIAKRMNLEART